MRGDPNIILLVEDNSDHAELIMRSLDELSMECTIKHVKDGEEALDYLLRRKAYQDAKESPEPDVVLLDLRLPKIDGLEVLQNIKNDDSLRRIPVVILSTSEAEKDVSRAYDFHANGYLVKPLDFDKFMDLLKDFGNYWLGWNVRLH